MIFVIVLTSFITFLLVPFLNAVINVSSLSSLLFYSSYHHHQSFLFLC